MMRQVILTCALVAAVLPRAALFAQPMTSPARTSITASATLDFLSVTTPAMPSPIPKSRARCAPHDCWSQLVTIKANARWKLQVRLASTPTGFLLATSLPSSPNMMIATLGTVTWVDTPLAGTATMGTTAEVTVIATRLNGPSGRLPTAPELASVLQYQVVRIP